MRRGRRAGFDELGLRRAPADRVLPLLVAAMAFLAALALAGWVGSASLARAWREGAGAALTVQVPRPTESAAGTPSTRLAAVVGVLSAARGVATVHALSDRELAALLRPWLGADADRLAVPLPAVIAVHLAPQGADLSLLGRQIGAAAPGSLLEDHDAWSQRLSALAHGLQACALLALLLVAGIAASVIAVATRAGLASRRETIEIVHGLGATDLYIAGRFARRATLQAAAGGLAGAAAAVPVLLALAGLAAPFTGRGESVPDAAGAVAALPAVLWIGLPALPAVLWIGLPALPAGAALIGFLTAQGTVLRWLRRLP